MGVKSRTRAEKRKDAKRNIAFASLKNVPTSPRKMRLVADLIRGERVEHALHILKTNPKDPAIRLHKLVLSAIANWQMKNEGMRIEESDLYIKEIQVDSARILKRIRPAPQGRAHRIRKRSNHVTIILDSLNKPEVDIEEPVEEVENETKPKADKAPKVETKPKKAPRATVKKEADKAPEADKKAKSTKAAPKAKKETEVKTKNKED